MRVVTRALSMASTVSASPGPVPGAGGNCAATGVERAAAVPPMKMTNAKRVKKELTRPPAARDGLGFIPLTVNCRLRTSKRPLSHFACANEKRNCSQGNLRQAPLSRGTGLPEKPGPAKHWQHGGQGIEQHLERQALCSPATSDYNYADGLPDKLH